MAAAILMIYLFPIGVPFTDGIAMAKTLARLYAIPPYAPTISSADTPWGELLSGRDVRVEYIKGRKCPAAVWPIRSVTGHLSVLLELSISVH